MGQFLIVVWNSVWDVLAVKVDLRIAIAISLIIIGVFWWGLNSQHNADLFNETLKANLK